MSLTCQADELAMGDEAHVRRQHAQLGRELVDQLGV